MKLRIEKSIFDLYPDLNLGAVVFQKLDNTGTVVDIQELLRKEMHAIRSKFDLEILSCRPRIQAWRHAYSLFGAKPKKYLSSVENLYRMILKGRDLRSINPVVDLYNLISLKYMLPVGGDDLSRIEGGIVLRRACGDERFIPLNCGEIESPKPGEVIYTDDRDVLCRRWNWRESDKSKMTESSSNICLVIEGIPPAGRDIVEAALLELIKLLSRFCGGEYHSGILDQNFPEMKIF